MHRAYTNATLTPTCKPRTTLITFPHYCNTLLPVTSSPLLILSWRSGCCCHHRHRHRHLSKRNIVPTNSSYQTSTLAPTLSRSPRTKSTVFRRRKTPESPRAIRKPLPRRRKRHAAACFAYCSSLYSSSFSFF